MVLRCGDQCAQRPQTQEITMKLHFPILLAAALATVTLSGCAQIDALTGTTTATSTLADAEKILAATHLAHAAAADGLTVAATSGAIKGADATKAKGLLDQSEAYLSVADNAATLGDAASIQSSTATATALVAQVNALIHPSK
jgi:hypothetical protein